MGATIHAPSVTDPLPDVVAPIVQIKENWPDLWENAPDLLATSLSTASAGQDLSRLVFHRRYGDAKDTYEAAFSTRVERPLLDHWIRVRTLNAGATDLQTVFVGRISGDDASKFASSSVLAGVQQWVAYGPAQILRKRFVGKSFHKAFGLVADEIFQEVEWIPPLNDPNKSETGNRSAATVSVPGDPFAPAAYLYGGTDLWTYRQYIEYLLAFFLNDEVGDVPPGPRWTLTGQAEILEDLSTPIRWGTTQNVSQMLRKLIPLDRGIDYTVRIVDADLPAQNGPEKGYEIFVYATSPLVHSFAGVTLPKNSNEVVLNAGEAKDLSPSPRIVVSHDRKFKRIRILGKRIIVCCSLWAANAPSKAQVPEDAPGIPSYSGTSPASFPTLVAKWANDIEAEYQDGPPNSDDEADHDEYRRQDKFRDLYSSLGAPVFWDMHDAFVTPRVDDEGLLVVDDPETEDTDESLAPYQLDLRRTLSWIPLREGEDWTDIASAPTGARGVQTDIDDHQADYLPPIAWLFDPSTYSYLESTQFSIGVRPKRNDWGVLLRAAPNHIMGQNHFGSEGESQLKTAKWPRYDWEELIVTIAFEADQRYTMEWSHADATDKDGVLEIAIDAELHYLAPNTVVAAPFPDSTPAVVLSGDAGRVIRADRELLGLTMAGAISRYGWGRDRATVPVRGLLPWHDLVGQMLTRIDQVGASHDVNGVISGVTWDMPLNGSPATIIRAGYPD